MENNQDIEKIWSGHKLHFMMSLGVEQEKLSEFVGKALLEPDIKKPGVITTEKLGRLNVNFLAKVINKGLALMSLSDDQKIYAFYPMVLCVSVALVKIKSINQSENGLEAKISAQICFPQSGEDEGAPTIEFFAVDYYKNSEKYIPDSLMHVSFAGVVYAFMPLRQDVNYIIMPLTQLDAEGAGTTNWKSDEFWCQGEISEIIELEEGNKILKVKVIPSLMEVSIYANSSKIKSDYKIGDIVSAGIWLQGSVAQKATEESSG